MQGLLYILKLSFLNLWPSFFSNLQRYTRPWIKSGLCLRTFYCNNIFKIGFSSLTMVWFIDDISTWKSHPRQISSAGQTEFRRSTNILPNLWVFLTYLDSTCIPWGCFQKPTRRDSCSFRIGIRGKQGDIWGKSLSRNSSPFPRVWIGSSR